MSNLPPEVPVLAMLVDTLSEVNHLFTMMQTSLKLTTARGEKPNYGELHLLMVLNAVQAMSMLDSLQVEMLIHDPELAMQIAEAHAFEQNQWAFAPSSN